MIRTLVVVALVALCWPLTARGDNLCRASATAVYGTFAVCSGTILPAAWAIKCSTLKIDNDKCASNAVKAEKTFTAKWAAENAKQISCLERVARQKHQIEKLTRPPAWHDNKTLWAVVGFAAGAAVSIGIFSAAGRSK